MTCSAPENGARPQRTTLPRLLTFASPCLFSWSSARAAVFGANLADMAADSRLTDVALSGYGWDGEFTRSGLLLLAAAALPQCPRLSLHIVAVVCTPRGGEPAAPDDGDVAHAAADAAASVGPEWARVVAALPERMRDRVHFSHERWFENAERFYGGAAAAEAEWLLDDDDRAAAGG